MSHRPALWKICRYGWDGGRRWSKSMVTGDGEEKGKDGVELLGLASKEPIHLAYEHPLSKLRLRLAEEEKRTDETTEERKTKLVRTQVNDVLLAELLNFEFGEELIPIAFLGDFFNFPLFVIFLRFVPNGRDWMQTGGRGERVQGKWQWPS